MSKSTLVVKGVDLTDYTLFQLNHLLRKTNPFTLNDVHIIVNWLDSKGLNVQAYTMLNQVNGMWCWQIKEL